MNDGGPIRLSEFLRPELVVAPLESSDAEEVIADLVRALALGGEIAPELIDELTARALRNERQNPTGIKKGLALPNCSAEGLVRTACALGVSPEGVDFKGLDGEPAHAIFLFACPENTYRRVLMGLEATAALFEDTRLAEDLVDLVDAGRILDAIEEAEADEFLYEHD